MAAAAVGEQLVGFLERAPGASLPRDIEHLRRQSALIDAAEPGGWRALPELALDPGAIRSRSVDVALVRLDRREAILSEIWDWFDDVGSSLRTLDSKRDALLARLRAEHGGEWTARCLFIVRRTRRNERLVSELRPLFAARFPGSSLDWLAALSGPQPMPSADGFLWSTATYRLQASRLGRAEQAKSPGSILDRREPTGIDRHQMGEREGGPRASDPRSTGRPSTGPGTATATRSS